MKKIANDHHHLLHFAIQILYSTQHDILFVANKNRETTETINSFTTNNYNL